MSESMSSPWIRDYLMDVAETYGAQVHNAPVSNKKKKVQLTDLLTYQEDSYVWACVSDKDYRVSVRISKDAVDRYRGTHGRSVFDSRFFLVSISSYRPMFSPRPLGPNALGKTPVSHISLEVSCLSQIGTGGHLFGNPRDLETDENMREWTSGLRQDGGGGNVLKLRKQQNIVQNKKTLPSLPSPPPLQLSPALQHQKPKAAKKVAAPEPERPQDFKRVYAKRWRKVEVDRWKFAIRPVEERPTETEINHSPVEPLLGAAKHVESRGLLACPTSPPRAPSPISLQRQGTPTDWSLSDRGGSVALDETNISALGIVSQQHDESEALPTTPRIPSDTEGHILVDTEVPASCSTQSTEHPESWSSLHSLFSDSLEDEQPVSSQAPIPSAGRAKDKTQEKASPIQALRHDSGAWKEPSFITRSKEKGKACAVEESDTPNIKVGRKRRRSAQNESPLSEQMSLVAPEVRSVAPNWPTTETPDRTHPRDTGASTVKKIHLNNRPPASPANSAGMAPPLPLQLPKPRLANFVVDFGRANLQGVPMPKLDLMKDIKSILLRTGRIRTLGEEVEKDGSVYIVR